MGSGLVARRGLTLMELVVALAVGGAAIAAGAAALGGLVDRQDTIDAQLARLDGAVQFRRALSAWATATQLDPRAGGVEFRGVDAARSGRADDSLTFRSVATDLGAERATEVSLHIARDSGSQIVIATRPWGSAEPAAVLLRAPAAALDIQYLLREGELVTWIDSWTSGTVLPAAIRVRIEGNPADAHPLLAYPLIIRLAP
mgnify:CR=1 FL=1